MSRFWPLASTPTGGTDGSNFTLGNAGHATEAGEITHLWFYRADAGASGIPVTLDLWNVATTSSLATVEPSGASAGVGWKAFELPTPVWLDANQIFAVSAYWPAGRTFTRLAGANRPTPETPLVWETNFARSNFGSNAYPATAGTATIEGVDVTFVATDVPDPGDPPDNADIETALARWFSSGAPNLRTGELPKLTHTQATLAREKADALVTRLDATGWPVSITGVNYATLGAALARLGALADLVNTATDLIKNWLGDPADPPADTLSKRVELLGEALTPPVNWAAGRVLGAAFHAFEDDQPFSSIGLWAPGPGLFKLNIDTWGQNQGAIALPNANTWLPRAGWWAPVFANAEIGERQFVEFQVQWLWPLPMGAVGVLVYCGPGTAGTIERYTLT